MANLFKAGLEKIATTAGWRIQQQSNAEQEEATSNRGSVFKFSATHVLNTPSTPDPSIQQQVDAGWSGVTPEQSALFDRYGIKYEGLTPQQIQRVYRQAQNVAQREEEWASGKRRGIPPAKLKYEMQSSAKADRISNYAKSTGYNHVYPWQAVTATENKPASQEPMAYKPYTENMTAEEYEAVRRNNLEVAQREVYNSKNNPAAQSQIPVTPRKYTEDMTDAEIKATHRNNVMAMSGGYGGTKPARVNAIKSPQLSGSDIKSRMRSSFNADSARLHDPINGAAVQPTNLMTLSPSTTPAT